MALGKILVDSGKVPEDAIRNALSLKFREALLGCFDWADGRFTFTPGDAPPVMDGLDVAVNLLDIHRESDLRQTAWRAIREVFPTGRVRLRLDRSQLASAPEPGSLDDRLYHLIEEGATIDDIGLALHSTDFFLYQRLYALHRLGAVSVVPSESPTVPTQVPTGPRRRAGLGGDPPPRPGLLRRGERRPTPPRSPAAPTRSRPPPQTANFLRQAETALADQLKQELFGQGRVPVLKVTPERCGGCRSPRRSATCSRASTGSGRWRPSSRSHPSTSSTPSAASGASSIRDSSSCADR